MHGDKTRIPPMSHKGLKYLRLLSDAAVTCTKRQISRVGPQTKTNPLTLKALRHKYSYTFHGDITPVILIKMSGFHKKHHMKFGVKIKLLYNLLSKNWQPDPKLKIFPI